MRADVNMVAPHLHSAPLLRLVLAVVQHFDFLVLCISKTYYQVVFDNKIGYQGIYFHATKIFSLKRHVEVLTWLL